MRTLLGASFLALGACASSNEEEAVETAPPQPEFVTLGGEATYPEGIITAPDGAIFVTGFGDGSIQRVARDGQVTYFRRPGEDGLSSAVGMAIDATRGRLWVANFAFATLRSDLKVYDLASGSLLTTVSPANETGPHFFNELAIDADGRVYVSDTLRPRIWTAAPDLTPAEVLVEDPALANPAGATDPAKAFGLNGLVLSPDGRYLVTSVMDRIDPGGGRLVRIDVASRAVSEVELGGDAVATFGGADGAFFEPGGLLVMVNVTPPAALVTAQFSADYGAAELVRRPRFDASFDRPTSSALRDGQLLVVDSQLDHIIDDQNGALNTPPTLPFRLTSVSFAELLDR